MAEPREVVARALLDTFNATHTIKPTTDEQWNETLPRDWVASWLAMADAVLAALEAAGYRQVRITHTKAGALPYTEDEPTAPEGQRETGNG